MVTYFRLLKNMENTVLEPEAEATLRTLILATMNSGEMIVKNSKVAIDICQNFRLSSSELKDWYKEQGIDKADSTIRSQQAYISSLFYSIFGDYDFLSDAFLNNDSDKLQQIRNRIYALQHSDFKLSDLGVNLSNVLEFADEDGMYDESKVDDVLSFIRSLNRKNIVANFDKCDKATLGTILNILCSPMILNKKYTFMDDNGIMQQATRVEFNKDKADLLCRMNTVPEFKPDEVIENTTYTAEKIIVKPEALPYKFLSMKEMCDIMQEYIQENCNPENMIDSGKTTAKAENLVKMFSSKEGFRKMIESINAFDLDASLDRFKV